MFSWCLIKQKMPPSLSLSLSLQSSAISMNTSKNKIIHEDPHTVIFLFIFTREWNKKAEFNLSMNKGRRGKLLAVSKFWGEMATLRTSYPGRVTEQRMRPKNGSYTPHGLFHACSASNRTHTTQWAAQKMVMETQTDGLHEMLERSNNSISSPKKRREGKMEGRWTWLVWQA